MPDRIQSGLDAVYDGFAGGWIIADGIARDARAGVSLRTDFDQIQVQTFGSQVLDSAGGSFVDAPDIDLSGSGDVSGNGFAITVSTAGGTGSGPLTGRFYGPVAEEVGGTFEVIESGTGAIYLGAFGAVR